MFSLEVCENPRSGRVCENFGIPGILERVDILERVGTPEGVGIPENSKDPFNEYDITHSTRPKKKCRDVVDFPKYKHQSVLVIRIPATFRNPETLGNPSRFREEFPTRPDILRFSPRL